MIFVMFVVLGMLSRVAYETLREFLRASLR